MTSNYGDVSKRLIILGIPDKTHDYEMIMLFTKMFPGEIFENVSLKRPSKPKQEGDAITMFGFVDCVSSEKRNYIVEQFPYAMPFSNSFGKKSNLFVHICKNRFDLKKSVKRQPNEEMLRNRGTEQKPAESKPLKNHSENDQNNNITEKGNNMVGKSTTFGSNESELLFKQLLKEQQEFLDFKKAILVDIQNAEAALASRIPLLYISDKEMKALSDAEEGLVKDVEGLQQELKDTYNECENVLIQMESLNER